jgi:hypothetical protein
MEEEENIDQMAQCSLHVSYLRDFCPPSCAAYESLAVISQWTVSISYPMNSSWEMGRQFGIVLLVSGIAHLHC